MVSPRALSSAHSSSIFTYSPCLISLLTTPTSPSILTPTTFNYILTAQTTYAPDRLSFCIKSIHECLTSNSLKLNPTKTKAIFLHLPLRSFTLSEPSPYYSTTPHSPILNTSETLASILIPSFPLTPILYICTNPSTTTYTVSA